MATVLPRAALVPLTGFWLMTEPAGTVALLSCVMLTARPAAWMAAIALPWVCDHVGDRDGRGRIRPGRYKDGDRAAGGPQSTAHRDLINDVAGRDGGADLIGHAPDGQATILNRINGEILG